jgi:hypothetical protein
MFTISETQSVAVRLSTSSEHLDVKLQLTVFYHLRVLCGTVHTSTWYSSSVHIFFQQSELLPLSTNSPSDGIV